MSSEKDRPDSVSKRSTLLVILQRISDPFRQTMMSMPRLSLVFCLLLPALTIAAPAQSSLSELEAAFHAERQELIRRQAGQVSLTDIKALANQHITRLEAFMAKVAEGRDLVNAHLMLTNIFMDIGEQAKAKSSLAKLPETEASALGLITAAEFAQILGEQDSRNRWIEMAIAKPAPFEDRMALGIVLMTRMVEVAKGEKLFADALSEARGNEDKSKVLWYRAAATREREDLEEGAYGVDLQALADRYPKTYYGSIAGDRLAAMDFKPGADAIAFRGKDLTGKTVTLADFKGKVLLLDFWASWSEPCLQALPDMIALRAKYQDRGLAMLSISIDEQREELEAAVAANTIPWPQLFDGKSWQGENALRYSVEQVPHMLLIGRNGKIAALRLFPFDAAGKEYLVEQIEAALGK